MAKGTSNEDQIKHAESLEEFPESYPRLGRPDNDLLYVWGKERCQ